MGVMDDLRYAVRALVRRPSVAIFSVPTIALGVGATTAMFGTVESVVLNPLPYDDGDRMVRLFERIGNSDSFIPLSPEHVSAWAAQTDIFEAVEPWTMRTMTLTGRGEPREVDAALIRPSYHDVIGWDPVGGARVRRFRNRRGGLEGAASELRVRAADVWRSSGVSG